MGLFGFLKTHNINLRIEEFRSCAGAVLVDVRGRQEYDDGHIPGAINIPLDSIQSARKIIAEMDIPVFTYCYTGRRSIMAVNALKKLGYSNVKNIGGIAFYKGSIDK